MADIETPTITAENPMAEIARKSGLAETSVPRRNVVILALPGVSDEEAFKFRNTLELLAPYLPFNLAITYNRVSALSREDIVEWKDKLDALCKANGWAK